MRQFLQLTDELTVMPWDVAAVKRSPLEADTCTVFLKGQSSQDGFVVKRPAEEVIEELEDAMAADEESEE